MINKSIFFLLSICFFSRINAQTLDVNQVMSNFIGASPEASAIATYQQCPVDYMTGIPQIDVPLFEVKTKMGSIPFSLSYHIGRIKTSELTGPVGFGWTLSPNIGISRSVKGVPDGINAGYTAANANFGSNSCVYLLGLSRSANTDEQPDNFYYSLLGRGGSFVYKQNQTFSTIPFDPIVISHPTEQSFFITDVDGTTYRFGKYSTGTTTCLEYTQAPNSVLTSWKVTEIISYDKSDTIKFIYNPTATQWQMPFYNGETKIIEYPNRSDLHTQIYQSVFNYNSNSTLITGWRAMRPNGVAKGPLPPEPLTVYDVNLTNDVNYVGGNLSEINQFHNIDCGMDFGGNYNDANVLRTNTIDEVQLTDVIYRGGKVSLTYNGTQISSLILYNFVNNQYQQVKRTDLFQHTNTNQASQPVTYFDNLNWRSLLDSVQFKGSDNIARETYKMGYIPESLGNPVPTVAAGYDADMFGYPANNQSFTTPALPFALSYYFCQVTGPSGPDGTYSGSPSTINGAIRLGGKSLLFNASALPAGMLQSLTYPTGGRAEFTFEQNSFKMRDASPALYGAGYRIAQIRYLSVTGFDSIIKVYHYGLGEVGYGVLRYQPTPADFISTQYYNTVNVSSPSNILQKITMANSSPFKDLAFDAGSAVLYPEVTEYLLSRNRNVGKTVYNYGIFGLNNIRLPNTPLQYDLRDGWKSTQLDSIRKYSYKNNAYAIGEKTTYGYTDYTKDNLPVGQAYQQVASASSSDDVALCAGSGGPVPATQALRYTITTGAKKKQQETETLYDPDDNTQFVQTVRSYTYNGVTLQLIGETETNSKGQSKQMKTWYPDDGAQSGFPAGQSTLLTSMVGANRINMPIQKQSLVNSIPQVTQQNYLVTADNGQIYPAEVWTGVRNNALVNQYRINKYDKFGNVLEQQKIGDVKQVNIWGYNGLYPVAKILGTDYATASALISQSLLDNSTTTDAQMRTELNKLRTGLTACQVSTYTYKPFVGATSETNPAGVTLFYEYDNFARLLLIRDNNNNIIKTFKYHYRGQQ